MPLAFARPGSIVKVLAIKGGRGVHLKLRDLGI
jgi:Fe2+ transport system protein FeoA